MIPPLARLTPVEIVWFKRDLRSRDHQPLQQALARGPTLGLFIVEPEWLNSAEFDVNHLRFVEQSIADLQKELSNKRIPLLVQRGSAEHVWRELRRKFLFERVYSHEETGLDWSFQRDLRLKKVFLELGVQWQEFRQFGVVRGLKTRNRWEQQHHTILRRPLFAVGPQSELTRNLLLEQNLNTDAWKQAIPDKRTLTGQLKPRVQLGGEIQGLKTLRSFLEQRGEWYSHSISSPLRAERAGSRLSPYLAWGNLSMSEVLQAVEKKKLDLELKDFHLSDPKERARHSRWRRSLQNFESRLAWHCHFIQKLESEPEIEFQNMNRAFDGLREADFDESLFEAWCRGETGFPMADACMRSLLQTGWINFRMRAMLMSFASYQLWLHWKKPAEFLARQFIDFEPVIHYPQVQMQSGLTGINTIRIYSPVKQRQDQDPQGDFVRRYLPELADLPLERLDHPWDQESSSFFSRVESERWKAYPKPVVSAEESLREAKRKIFQWRSRTDVKKAARDVLDRHGSRKSHFTGRSKGERSNSRAKNNEPNEKQLSLFDSSPTDDD